LVVMAPARWGQRDAHTLLREEPFIRYNRTLGGGKQADTYLRKAGIVPQALLGDVAPKLAQLTDDVLFGDVWARPGLSPRDRSLVTVSALIALNRPDQLRSHLARALDNGMSKDEISEALNRRRH